jgi:hypothetical protein
VISLACVLPLLAACPNQESQCVEIGKNLLVQVAESSQAQNTGDCALPPAFLLGGLGCNVALSYSADRCVVEYELLCIGGVQIDMNITQGQPDGMVGSLRKFDPRTGCSLDLEISVKPGPTSTPTLDAGAS